MTTPDARTRESLSPEQRELQQRRLAALARSDELRRRLLEENGGKLFVSSADLIHEAREERDEQLP